MIPVTLRAEGPGDVAAITKVHWTAFGKAGEAELVRELRATGDVDPALSRVSVLGDAIVGHVLFPAITIGPGASRVPALALAPVAVMPAYQRQGIGSLLIQDWLAVCRSLGYRIVIVLGNPAYYTRFVSTGLKILGSTARFPHLQKNSWFSRSSTGLLTGPGVLSDILQLSIR